MRTFNGACSASVSRMVRISRIGTFSASKFCRILRKVVRVTTPGPIFLREFRHLPERHDPTSCCASRGQTVRWRRIYQSEGYIKVRRHNGTGFNNGKAPNLRLALQGANPDGIKAKSWIDGFLALGSVPAAVPGLATAVNVPDRRPRCQSLTPSSKYGSARCKLWLSRMGPPAGNFHILREFFT